MSFVATTTLRFRCENPDCPDQGQEWEADAVETNGAVEVRYAEDECCDGCGHLGADQ